MGYSLIVLLQICVKPRLFASQLNPRFLVSRALSFSLSPINRTGQNFLGPHFEVQERTRNRFGLFFFLLLQDLPFSIFRYFLLKLFCSLRIKCVQVFVSLHFLCQQLVNDMPGVLHHWLPWLDSIFAYSIFGNANKRIILYNVHQLMQFVLSGYL